MRKYLLKSAWFLCCIFISCELDISDFHKKSFIADTHNDVLLRSMTGKNILSNLSESHSDFEKFDEGWYKVSEEVTPHYHSIVPDLDDVAGNVATSDAAKFLAKAGVDGVKVGIGPGSICTTRIVAGVGYPQLSAINNVYNALKGSNITIVADGGVKHTGDITKAIAAGADCVMLGSMLAGTLESPGETIIYEGRKFKTYRGMGSVEAMEKGSKERYFQSSIKDKNKLVPEGIVGRVPYKGSLVESMFQFTGGLKSGMGYCGASSIKDLKEKSNFVQITRAGLDESHPHNITITKESPNYTR